jgi:hypothetical protein
VVILRDCLDVELSTLVATMAEGRVKRRVLTFGAITTTFGSRLVFIVAPSLIVAIVIWLICVCFRVSEQDPPQARQIRHALLDTSRELHPPASKHSPTP